MRCLVIIPAFNESKNIIGVIDDIKTYCPEYDYIVINDGSTDDTREVLEKNRINSISLPINLGIGGAVQTGYKYALSHGYDAAVQFDGDGQHDARYLRDLVSLLSDGTADMVIGSRFLEGKGFQSSAMRRIGIRFLSSLIKIMGKIRVHDITSGMRAVNRSVIEHFAENYPQDYPEPETVLWLGINKKKVVEVPVEMRERSSGKSSITLWKSTYYMLKVSLALLIYRLSNRRSEKID